MPESTHPGSWVGDTVEEFKKLPTWGKAIAGIVALGVVIFAIHAYSKRASATTPTTTASGPSPVGTKTSASQLPPDSSQPTPYQPNYNLVGQNTAASTSQPATQQGVFATIRPKGVQGQPFYGADFNQSGVIARTSPTASSQAKLIPFGSQVEITGPGVVGQATKTTGSNVWYPVNGGFLSSQDVAQLQASPRVAASPPANAPASTGAVGRNSYVVQYGDNMNRVARLLGLGNWQDFGVDSFYHGQVLKVPA